MNEVELAARRALAAPFEEEVAISIELNNTRINVAIGHKEGAVGRRQYWLGG